MNKRVFAILVTTMLISMLGMGIVVPLLPIYADQLGASGLQIGFISAGFSLSIMVSLPFMGRLSDRIGRKIFLCTGLTILTLASLGFIWAQTPLQLIFARIFQGIGASMHFPIAQAYLGDITPEGEEGKWMGHFSAILFSGMSIGPLLGGVLTDVFSINTTFLVMAALCLVGLIATIIFLPKVAKRITSEGQMAAFTGLRKSNTLKGVFTLRMALGFSTASIMTFLPLFASQKLGLSVSLIGLLLASRMPLALLQSYTGTLADKYNRRLLVVAGSAVAIIFIALIPTAGSFWPLLVMHALMAIGIAFAMPAATAYVVEEGRTFGMGASMALFMMAMQVGNGLGPIIFGGIVDFMGIESAFYSGAIMLVMGIAAFIWFIRKQAPKVS